MPKRTLRARAPPEEKPAENVPEAVAAKQRKSKRIRTVSDEPAELPEAVASVSKSPSPEPEKRGAKKAAAKKKSAPAKKKKRPTPASVKSAEEDDDDAQNGASAGSSSPPPPPEVKSMEEDSQPEVPAAAAASSSSLESEVVDVEVVPEPIDVTSCSPRGIVEEEVKWKLATWNVAGMRALIRKQTLEQLLELKPDIICMQEVKAGAGDLPAHVVQDDGDYFKYWLESAEKKGYAGCALWSKCKPLNVTYGIGDAAHDGHGRVITAEFEASFVVCVYVPNAGRKLVNLSNRMRWNAAFNNYILKLDKIKPVVIGGDMNVAHNEIDLKNAKANMRNAGFSKEERDALTDFLNLGFSDVYRHHHPNETDCYTFWSYMGNARTKNIGWRLDYCIVSTRLLTETLACSNEKRIMGSDHCPVIADFAKSLF